jgi:hypothetical protein
LVAQTLVCGFPLMNPVCNVEPLTFDLGLVAA